MAEEETPQDVDVESLPETPRKPAKLPLMLLALVGAAVGARLGGPVVAPMLAGVVGSGGHDEAGGGGHGGGGGAPAEGPVVIDALVLNPAGSGGSRFLVAALSLDADARAQEALAARDAEARDLLLTVLSARTVEELSDISLRDEIREDLRVALNAMLGYEGVHRVFMPQFVIQ